MVKALTLTLNLRIVQALPGYPGLRSLALETAMPADKRLDAESCKAKAAECRALARQDRNENHRVMLLHMAETWERIAKTYENGK